VYQFLPATSQHKQVLISGSKIETSDTPMLRWHYMLRCRTFWCSRNIFGGCQYWCQQQLTCATSGI